ncbi:forkhead box protein N3 isoform X1 [Vulpes vulpes]|uniref:Forkhead box protein N3 n=1 Tax=Vulpes vulpes TaxID=9627 RepID=A0ABM4ZGK9_VULVU
MGPVMPPSKKPESSGISVSSGLSQCYRGSGFSKALQEDDDLDFSLPDIRLEEGAMEDEELTNLNWLHESKNLLKSFGESVLRSVSPVQDLDDDTPPSPAHSDMPYDARQNPNCKPPYSFSCLIFMAIEDSPTKRLPVKDIYNWILEHFPYFANAPTGWKNSVRHNLSLNKCFKKVDKERSQSIGKGSLWCIDPEYRQNLIQALKKTPYHPYSHVFNTPPASPQAYQRDGLADKSQPSRNHHVISHSPSEKNFLNHLDDTWQILPYTVVLRVRVLFLLQDCNHLLEL